MKSHLGFDSHLQYGFQVVPGFVSIDGSVISTEEIIQNIIQNLKFMML